MSGFAAKLERADVKKTDLPVFHVGDTLDVHVRIKEGDKERTQIFNGICIARKGGALRETFTVRRIVDGEGVERVFPLHSPNVVKIVVKRAGKVRRAKLYYLRDRVGKATRVKELVNAGHLGKLDEKRNAAVAAKDRPVDGPETTAEVAAKDRPVDAAGEKTAGTAGETTAGKSGEKTPEVAAKDRPADPPETSADKASEKTGDAATEVEPKKDK